MGRNLDDYLPDVDFDNDWINYSENLNDPEDPIFIHKPLKDLANP